MILTCIVLLAASSFATAGNLPKGWAQCKQTNQDEMNQCLKKALPDILQELVVHGNKKLGVYPLEPLRFTRLGIDSRGPVSINLTLSNLDVKNVKSIQIHDVDISWSNYEIKLNVSFLEPLNAVGTYDVSGKVLVLPIVGNGKCNLTLDGVTAEVTFNGLDKRSNKNTFVLLKQGLFDLKTTKLHIYLENLFKGDKALGDNMNKFLNENWAIVFDEIRLGLSQGIGEALKVIANRIFEKIPTDEFIPEFTD